MGDQHDLISTGEARKILGLRSTEGVRYLGRIGVLSYQKRPTGAGLRERWVWSAAEVHALAEKRGGGALGAEPERAA